MTTDPIQGPDEAAKAAHDQWVKDHEALENEGLGPLEPVVMAAIPGALAAKTGAAFAGAGLDAFKWATEHAADLGLDWSTSFTPPPANEIPEVTIVGAPDQGDFTRPPDNVIQASEVTVVGGPGQGDFTRPPDNVIHVPEVTIVGGPGHGDFTPPPDNVIHVPEITIVGEPGHGHSPSPMDSAQPFDPNSPPHDVLHTFDPAVAPPSDPGGPAFP